MAVTDVEGGSAKVLDESQLGQEEVQGGGGIKATAEEGETPYVLHEQFPSWVGYVSLAFLVGNVGLQVYSHLGASMAVMSNIDVSDETAPLLSNVVSCSANDTIFADWWVDTGSEDVYNDMIDCAPAYLGADSGEEFDDLETCLRDDAGYEGSQECILCYQDYLICASASSANNGCLDACLPSVFSRSPENDAMCFACTEEKCNLNFELCTGFFMPDPPDTGARRALHSASQPRRALADGPPETLYTVYEISFVRTITDAWESGAYGVSIILLLLSGIWPYTKNLIMLAAWFAPMTTAQRSALLKGLTRLAKWSLFDVFVVVIILAGLRLDVEGDVIGRIYLITESRPAIYTFCLAAIWDLYQGEWMRTKHLEVAERDSPAAAKMPPTAKVVHDADKGLLKSATFGPSASSCGPSARAIHLVVSVAQLALIAAGCFLPCVTFGMGGNAYGLYFNSEPGVYAQHSVFSLATAIVSPETLEAVGNEAGAYFLAIVFLACAIFVPFIVFSGMTKALHIQSCGPFHPRTSLLKKLMVFCDVVGGFASLDVFLLSVAVTMLEWDRFVNSAMSTLTERFIGCPDPCLESQSEMEYAVYLVLGAVVLGWVLELLFTYVFAQIYHPTEQTLFGPLIFGHCTRCFAR